MKKQGHYCKVCGEYKANEKFSGKGHTAHICKSCASMSVEERNQEMTLTRIMNLPWYLSKEQCAWLKKHCHDKRSVISEAAQEAYDSRFPFAKRNEQKKQYHVDHLTLMVNDDAYDEYGDPIELNAVFEVSRRNATISMREDDQTTSVKLQPADMNKLLKWMVHTLEIFCWQEDYVASSSDDADEDMEEWADDEAGDAEDNDLPICWQLDITYRNDENQQVSSPYSAPDRVLELVQELLSYLFAEKDDDDLLPGEDDEQSSEDL